MLSSYQCLSEHLTSCSCAYAFSTSTLLLSWFFTLCLISLKRTLLASSTAVLKGSMVQKCISSESLGMDQAICFLDLFQYLPEQIGRFATQSAVGHKYLIATDVHLSFLPPVSSAHVIHRFPLENCDRRWWKKGSWEMWTKAPEEVTHLQACPGCFPNTGY